MSGSSISESLLLRPYSADLCLGSLDTSQLRTTTSLVHLSAVTQHSDRNLVISKPAWCTRTRESLQGHLVGADQRDVRDHKRCGGLPLVTGRLAAAQECPAEK